MNRIKVLLGIDKAIFFTLFGRFWSVAAGLVTIFMVTHFLSPELQGYYYTFNSLIALQIFVELGLTYVIIQFSSHEMAHLIWQKNGTVLGDAQSKRRLQSLINFSITWFGIAALLIILILLPVGVYFFNSSAVMESSFDSSIPWSILVVFTAINLIITAAAAILEGCGKVSDIAVLRLLQSLASVTVTWLVLWNGGGIYAIVVNCIMLTIVGGIWIWYKYRSFFIDILRYSKNSPGMDWRNEIWPFQWKIALSWMSGYLIFQLFNPLLFATHGPIAAGKMGMSLQIIAAMNAAAMAWISTKVPTYGKMVVSGKTKELDALVARGFLQSFCFLLSGIIGLGLIFLYLSEIKSPFSSRVLPLPLLLILAFVSLGNHVVSVQGAYLRAHKEEPFMMISIITGISTALFALLWVPHNGVAGAVYAYAISALGIGLIGGTTIFFRKRRQWAIKRISATL
ncbi:lipopolysaccharide biosynthesis protein [Janthinobacterium sp. 64]|uniref:lipopolysaccharide biosynthesis protein n=1 Tax=Janthinobacterium sp. 64 TaxID=2035208 RepID=UPI000C2BF289|nr:oligosaccharide flippase family protein [Janthinobacterium sp. 64]PKB22449.1 Na+-driven multidrug efflux pump [Janthinobacterium sp. 64]